jgi:hypothetical protein
VHPTTLEKNTTRFKNTVDFLYKKWTDWERI